MSKNDENWIDVVFDGPPGRESGRFVEVEDASGRGIKLGEWVHREDGYWVLRFVHSEHVSSGGERAGCPYALPGQDCCRYLFEAEERGECKRALPSSQPEAKEVEVIDPWVMDLVRKHGSTMTNAEIVQNFLPKQRLSQPEPSGELEALRRDAERYRWLRMPR